MACTSSPIPRHPNAWAARLVVSCALAAAHPADGQSLEPARIPGFSRPVQARWLGPEERRGGIPLGGLGTGFLELRPDGRVSALALDGAAAPTPPPACGIQATVGTESVTLLGTAPTRMRSRFFGHFPMADVEYGTRRGVAVCARAVGTLAPGDLERSGIPAVLFRVTVQCAADVPTRATLSLFLDGSAPPDGARSTLWQDGGRIGVLLAGGEGAPSLAAGMDAGGWGVQVRPNTALQGQIPRGRLEASATLRPGEERSVLFVIGWHPGARSPSRHARRFRDAAEAAARALRDGREIEVRAVAWQSGLYGRGLPDWLAEASLAAASLLTRNTVWPEGGAPRIRDSDLAASESLTARHHSAALFSALFASAHRQALDEIARTQAPDGGIPANHRDGAPPGRLASARFALLVWRARAEALYPAALRALRSAFAGPRGESGLITEPDGEAASEDGRPFGPWQWHGTAAWTAGMGLAALRAGEEMARAQGDSRLVAWCRQRFEAGRTAFDQDLWNGRWHRAYTDPDQFRDSESCLAGQLSGQEEAWLLGLGAIHGPGRIAASLRSIEALCMSAAKWGAVAAARPNGEPDLEAGQFSGDVLPGEVWNLAATAVLAARELADDSLRGMGLRAGERLWQGAAGAGELWSLNGCIGRDDARPYGAAHAASWLAVWNLVEALGGTAE